MSLFEVKPIDTQFYEKYIKDFLPPKIIDIHTHLWLDEHRSHNNSSVHEIVSWPSMVALDNSAEDIIESYKLMFPDKEVTPLIFSSIRPGDDFDVNNNYIKECSEKYDMPALYYSSPEMSAEYLENKIIEGKFLGIKAYLDHAPAYIPSNEIRIFDYFPHHQLEVMNRLGMIVMCHIPRSGRLKDPVNLAQLLEIEEKYPNLKLIVAHVGRAYCPEDIGNAFEVLAKTKNMLFDITANCLELVFEKLIETVSAKRILFGSDLPILRMRTKRICENGTYINLVPKGLYGDVSGDSHMREVTGEEADNLTFFMYEEIDAFRKAAEKCNLSKDDIADVFYNNAFNLINDVKTRMKY